MIEIDLDKKIEYENNFYLSSSIDRISKFATHLELFKRASCIAGDIVECGVFKGASLCKFIKFRSLFETPFTRRIIAFDTFDKFPKAGYKPDIKLREEFIRVAGDRSISKTKLISILKKLNLYENIELVKGDILEAVPDYKLNNPQLKISLLHIDVDLYESTKACLENLYPLVTKGGIVILDDYGAFAGANKAIDEFFFDRAEKIKRLPYSNAISFVEVN